MAPKIFAPSVIVKTVKKHFFLGPRKVGSEEKKTMYNEGIKGTILIAFYMQSLSLENHTIFHFHSL